MLTGAGAIWNWKGKLAYKALIESSPQPFPCCKSKGVEKMSLRAFALTGVAACFIAQLSFTALAQTSSAKPAPRVEKARPAAKSSADTDAEQLAEIRRTTAVSLALALAEDARSFRDPTLAARVQARTADALWEADNDRARGLFRRAWETADAADRENLRREEEERRREVKANGAYAYINAPNLRAEVLRLAAKRDRALGEEFLGKLDEAKKQDEEATSIADENARKSSDPSQSSQAITQRLQLAQGLLAEDQIERALQFADPVLRSVTREGLSFLSTLRQKDAKAADERYTRLLVLALQDPSADANTVSLLGSYIFTPYLFVTVDAKGGVNSSRSNREDAPADIQPALRTAFLNTAAQILLRPLPQPEQDTSTSGRTGLYFIIARLLPLFDQYMPERSPNLRAQMAALTQNTSEDVRSGRSQWLKEGLVPEAEAPEDTVKDSLERAEREQNPLRRNQAYAQAALAAAGKGDMRARDYADKIDDTEMRKAARAYVDYELVTGALNRKAALEAVRLARTGELTRIQRVWAYTEGARFLVKTDAARAAEILEDAIAEAERIGASDPDHARARVSIATVMFEVNHQRGWEMMSEAIKASNSADGFTGADGRVNASFITKGSASISDSSVDSFDLEGIFNSLARDDFERAVELTKLFNTEAPRAAATLAIVHTVLNEKKK
jgi:hypothetical protein